MSLPHILLGILAEPKSGYEIRQMFDSSLRHFWFAELSQIYPALKKLEAEGMLTSTTQPSEKGPDKRTYSRTIAGRDTLMDWLSDGPVEAPVRQGILAQIFFMSEQADPEAACRFFQTLKTRFTARRKALEAIEHEWRQECPSYPDDLSDDEFYPQLTLDIGLELQKTYENWCDRAVRRIRARIKG